MDGQSRLTVNLLMWSPRGLNFWHVEYVMLGSNIIKKHVEREERGLVFYNMWAPHDIFYMAKI